MATPAETAYGQAAGRDGTIKQLVLDNLPLVRRIVSRLCASLEMRVSEEDLISAGTLGLVEAAHRFDPAMGVKFATFGYWRVKGAVMDYLRQNDSLGKSARARLGDIRRCVRELSERNGRKPTIEELALAAGMSERDVLKCLSYEKWDYIGSLQDAVDDAEGEGSVLAALIPADAETPLQKLQWKERIERLSAAVKALPEREKQVIVMYYYEDLYMAEMAEILKVSESRVSQLHTRALYNLTRKLEGDNG